MSFKTNSKYCLKYVWGTPFRGAAALYVVKPRKQKHSFFILSCFLFTNSKKTACKACLKKQNLKFKRVTLSAYNSDQAQPQQLSGEGQNSVSCQQRPYEHLTWVASPTWRPMKQRFSLDVTVPRPSPCGACPNSNNGVTVGSYPSQRLGRLCYKETLKYYLSRSSPQKTNPTRDRHTERQK